MPLLLSLPLPLSLAWLLSAGEVSIDGLKAMEFLLLASDKKDIVPVSVIAQYSAETKSNGFVKVSDTLHTTVLNSADFSPGTFYSFRPHKLSHCLLWSSGCVCGCRLIPTALRQ